MRRTLVLAVGGTLLVSLVFLDRIVQGQPLPAQRVPPASAPGAPPPGPASAFDAAELPRATLPTDAKVKRKLEAVRDYIAKKDWITVATAIQELLDQPQDVFVPITETGPGGKETTTLVGIRTATHRLLATIPADGLNVYRTQHGATAKKWLKDAVATGDLQLLNDVIQRFLYTEAGGEAAERYATLRLDRGEFAAAARAFDLLIQRDGLGKLEPLTLFKAALAFQLAGDKESLEKKNKVWKELADRAPDGLRINDQTVALEDLEKLLDRNRPVVVGSIHDYPQFGGDVTRNAQGIGGAPFMIPSWRQPLAIEGQTKSWIYEDANSALKRLEGRGEAALPGTFPIAVAATSPKDGKQYSILVFRTYQGISAVDLKTGKLRWISPSNGSLDRMLRNSEMLPALNQWVSFYKDQVGKPNVLLENSAVGSLTTDGTRVYAVEDLAVPPFTYDPRMGMGMPNGSPFVNKTVNDAVQHNRLQAIHIISGKLLWELGGKRPPGEPEVKDPTDFLDTYFLGPPLFLGGKIYFLNEKNQDLRLVCLDPNKLPERPSEADKKKAVVWVQTLCTAKDKILQDYGRRITACHIAYGEGILVCPTNAGVLLGVDVLSHNLVWAHPYSDQPSSAMTPPYDQPWIGRRPYIPPGNRPISSDWKMAAPIIHEGKVIFTGPDGSEVRCLNLRNGTKIWGEKRQQDDLYLAGVMAGQVVIVGKKYVRGISLENGSKETFRVETGGMPSGRGVASNNIYYVPLKEATFPDKEKAPAVCGINVELGKLVSLTRSRPDPINKDVPVPGNLIFFDGDVISQSCSEVVAYPQLDVKLARMNELLARNPEDPRGLFERGDLRLDQGNLVGAVEDLHKALVNKLPDDMVPRAKLKLFEAMTDLLQRNFAQGEKYLAEYEQMCSVQAAPSATPAEKAEAEAETKRRQLNYLALLGKGREGQGRLVDAFQAYTKFSELGSQSDELVTVLGEPSNRARADVWAQGRISNMIATAQPEQLEPLGKAIAATWEEVSKSTDLEKLRNFVALFGSSLPVGREARLQLAERLMEQEGKSSLIDAERHLLLLEQTAGDPTLAARAVETMARLQTRKGLLEDAAFYYRRLRDHYGSVVVRDGKTGAQLHAELATDKRFIPYVEEPLPARRKLKAVGESGSFPMTNQHQVYTFEVAGEPLPFFQQYRVALHRNTSHFLMTNRRTGEEKWKEPVNAANFQNYLHYIYNTNPNQPARAIFDAQTVGHLLVLNLGQTVVALDPVAQKVLWEKNLFGAQGMTAGGQPRIDPNDGSLELWFPDQYVMKIGQSGPVAASYVCLQTREGLMALDPLTGRTLWMRSDVPSRCHIFGDDKHVYVVEMDANKVATSTRAFRASDGAAVAVPNFAAKYQKRVRVMGRILVWADNDPARGMTLRMTDVHDDKELWSKDFPTNSVVMRSEDPDLAGVVSPEGRATVVSLRQRKEVVVGVVDTKHVEKLQQAHLLADAQHVYVAFHVNDPQANMWGGLQPNLLPGTGLRGVNVNGAVYAFDRRTSRIKWLVELHNQQLVLEQWRELPVLIFTSRYNKPQGPGGRFGVMQVVGVECYDKVTGKATFHRPELGQHIQHFYALTIDARSGKIEFISPNYKVTHTYEDQTAAVGAGGGGGASGSSGSSGSTGAQASQPPQIGVQQRIGRLID